MFGDHFSPRESHNWHKSGALKTQIRNDNQTKVKDHQVTVSLFEYSRLGSENSVGD